MAIASYGTFLMKKTGSTYAKLVDIRDFPDLGGAPEMLDKTTLTDTIQKFINGIKSNDALEFNANYDKADYRTINALKNTDVELSVWFGGTESNGELTPTGAYGKFDFTGQLSVRVTGQGVNEVVGMAITVAPSTDIVLQADSE